MKLEINQRLPAVVGRTNYDQNKHYQSLVDSLSPEQLAAMPNMERWLIQCPPRYRQFSAAQYSEYNIPTAGAAMDMADAHKDDARKHQTLLYALYKVATKLPGITVHHNAQALLRDVELIKFRVVKFEVLWNRLAEIEKRDDIRSGRRFCLKANPEYVCTVTNTIPGYNVTYVPNFPGAVPLKHDWNNARRLLSIGKREWRWLD
jgi:hypothetical protein